MDLIKVRINKKNEEIEENTTVQELIDAKGLKSAAVWVNGKQILKSEYEKYTLEAKDDIRLLRLMAGG